jgi:hypothetical protein
MVVRRCWYLDDGMWALVGVLVALVPVGVGEGGERRRVGKLHVGTVEVDQPTLLHEHMVRLGGALRQD